MNPASREARCILVIEDNPGDVELIRAFLAELPGSRDRIETVTTLQAGIAMLQSAKIDAVLLDLQLPDARGVDSVRRLRACAPQMPIVVLTGVDDDSVALACVENGAQEFLSKSEVRTHSLRRALGHAIARVQEGIERQRADALQERLAAIVDASGDAIVSSTIGGLITSWNRGAERIFGYTRDETIGRAFEEIIRPADEAGAQEQTRRIAETARLQGATIATEVIRLHKDGRPLTLSVVACNLRDRAGNVNALAVTCRDVTEARRHENELRQRNEQLQVRDRQMRALMTRLNAVREDERTRISREVHDELGQRLTGLKMDLRWIGRRLDPNAFAAAAPIAAKLRDAEELIDGTVRIVQRIAVELRPSALDALGLPAAIRDEARRFEQRSGVRAEVKVTPMYPDQRVATELFRILQELLTNVARHAHASVVRIQLEQDQTEWTLLVEDDGVGLRTDERRQDEAPARAPALERRAASLGLLGMRERAESLGGSIEIRSGAERGARALVRVPRLSAGEVR